MPFSTKSPNIPVITSQAQLEQMMLTWRNTLNRIVKASVPPPPPFNFTVKQARGGLQLTWGVVNTISTTSGQNGLLIAKPGGSDGYTILASQSGDFVSDVQVIRIRDNNQTNYFYPLTTPTKMYFKMHTTSGTTHDPQSIHGTDTATVSHTSLDPNDTATKPTSNRDNYTTDAIRAKSRFGRYVNHLNLNN